MLVVLRQYRAVWPGASDSLRQYARTRSCRWQIDTSTHAELLSRVICHHREGSRGHAVQNRYAGCCRQKGLLIRGGDEEDVHGTVLLAVIEDLELFTVQLCQEVFYLLDPDNRVLRRAGLHLFRGRQRNMDLDKK